MGQACFKCIMRITVKDASTMTEGMPLLSIDEQDGERAGLRSRVNTASLCLSLLWSLINYTS